MVYATRVSQNRKSTLLHYHLYPPGLFFFFISPLMSSTLFHLAHSNLAAMPYHLEFRVHKFFHKNKMLLIYKLTELHVLFLQISSLLYIIAKMSKTNPLEMNNPDMSKINHVETGEVSNVEKLDGDRGQFDPNSGVKRALKNRHLSMMALAGIIGPGLMVGTGGALAKGGPAALIIGFGVIGLIAFSITQSVGEITTLYPTGGAFIKQGERFVDKAFSFAMGWNYFVIWVTVLANE